MGIRSKPCWSLSVSACRQVGLERDFVASHLGMGRINVMKPRIQLAECSLSNGDRMALYCHDGAYSIRFNGQELMHSNASHSEYRMGRICRGRKTTNSPVRVLVGGLGLGFTVLGVLEEAGPDWEIVVAEMVPEVIDWNQQHLHSLNGFLLEDPRVKVRQTDVIELIREDPAGSYDAILFDIDNGPVAMVSAGNTSLYSSAGIRSVLRVLKAGGRAVYWSAGPDAAFLSRLRRSGLIVSLSEEKRNRGAKRAAVTLFIADKPVG
jgi:predicted methyltransferase